MNEQQLNLAIITGSTREGRLSPAVARWVHEQASEVGGFTTEVIDIASLALPATMSGQDDDAAVTAWRRRIAIADAFVVTVPEYNHSYPAPLKHVIDFAYEEWSRKPVGLVSYGGASGGVRAAEHLRGVFAGTASVTVRNNVSLAGIWRLIGREGVLSGGSHSAKVRSMLDELGWWGRALRDARRVDTRTAA
jgi:NAD(P)H-dependent FMN reductase